MRVPLILTIKKLEPSSIGLSKMSHCKESCSQLQTQIKLKVSTYLLEEYFELWIIGLLIRAINDT